MKTAVHGSTTISYYDEGEGQAILCIPSLGRGAEDFGIIAHRLVAEEFRVLRPQPRGVGGGTLPTGHLTLHDYAADAACVLEKAGAGPAVIVGHAFGNFIARCLATDRPDLVRGLVLAAASPGKGPSMPGDVQKAIADAGNLDLPEEKRLKALRLAFFAKGADASVWLSGWHPKAMKAQGDAEENTKVDDYFAGGHARVLILSAEEDAVAPPAAEKFFENALSPRATLRSIAHAGHALLPEQPAAVAAAIAEFARKS